MTSDVQRFLNVSPDASPREVLGLPSGLLTSIQIESALRDRLAQVMAHPEGRFESAGAIKELLREAAELLLMEVARVSRIRQHVSTSPILAQRQSASRPHPTVPPWQRTTPPIRLTHFDRHVLAVLVGSGGWNNRCRARLVALASQHGVTVQGLSRVIDGLATYARAGGPRLGIGQITAGQSRIEEPPPAHVLSPAASQVIAALSPADDPADAPWRGWRTVQLSLVFGIVTVIAGIFALQAVLTPSTSPRSGDEQAQSAPGASNVTRSPTPVAPTSPAGSILNTPVRPLVFQTEPTFTRSALPVEATIAADLCPSLPIGLEELARHIQVAQGELSLATSKKWQADIDTIATGWVLLDDSTRRDIHRSIIDVLQVASNQPARLSPLLDALTPSYTRHGESINIWRSAWKAGALADIASDEHLPAAATESASQRLRAALQNQGVPDPVRFETGARAFLDSNRHKLIASIATSEAGLDAWELWIRANDELSRGESFDSSMLGAVHDLLITSSDIARDSLAIQVIGRLLDETNLANSPVARDQLLAWYADESISSRAVWVITSLLDRRDGIPWFTSSQLIGPDADIRHRRRMRDQLAQLWPAAHATGSDTHRAEGIRVDPALHIRWQRLCDALETLPAAHSLTNAQQRLIMALVASRLNEVAANLAAAQTDIAAVALDELERIISPPSLDEADTSHVPQGVSLWLEGLITRQATVRPGQPLGTDGQWAAAYEANRNNAEERLRWLQRLQTDVAGDLGPIDAEAFVRIVYTGSPQDVRALAQSILLERFAAGPTIALEMLNQFRQVRAREDLSFTIERLASTLLPSFSDAHWPHAARRALLEHAIGLRRSPTDDASAIIDALTDQLAASYIARAATISPNNITAAAAPLSPAVAADALQLAWRDVASSLIVSRPVPAPLEELDRRARTRQQHADGAVQQFVARQIGILELMAYIVAAEQPAIRESVAAILIESADRREALMDVLDQVLEVEHQMLRLWQQRIHSGPVIARIGAPPWT